MKRSIWLVVVAAGCTVTTAPPVDEPAVPATVSVMVTGSDLGAAVIRIEGPAPGATLSTVPASLHVVSDTVGTAVVIAVFGDNIDGLIGRLVLGRGSDLRLYKVTVSSAASTSNSELAPGAVTVRLVKGGT